MKTSLVLTNCEGSPDFSVRPSFWQLASSESFPLGSESWEGFQALRHLAGAGWLRAALARSLHVLLLGGCILAVMCTRPAMPSSSEHPRSVQAVGQRSHGSHLCGKFNFVPCRVLAARLLAQRVKRKDLTASLEDVWTRVGLCSWVLEVSLGF